MSSYRRRGTGFRRQEKGKKRERGRRSFCWRLVFIVSITYTKSVYSALREQHVDFSRGSSHLLIHGKTTLCARVSAYLCPPLPSSASPPSLPPFPVRPAPPCLSGERTARDSGARGERIHEKAALWKRAHLVEADSAGSQVSQQQPFPSTALIRHFTVYARGAAEEKDCNGGELKLSRYRSILSVSCRGDTEHSNISRGHISSRGSPPRHTEVTEGIESVVMSSHYSGLFFSCFSHFHVKKTEHFL